MRLKHGGALAGLMLAGLAVVACHPGTSASPGAASASAKAHAAVASAEANPTLQAAADQALTDVQTCAKSTVGLVVTIPAPGSGQQVSVSHVRFHVVRHPLGSLEAIYRCTPAGKKNGKAGLLCIEKVAENNGLGTGVLAKDLTGMATACVAGKVKVGATASPSPSAAS